MQQGRSLWGVGRYGRIGELQVYDILNLGMSDEAKLEIKLYNSKY